jgi:predicted transcriptional regulator
MSSSASAKLEKQLTEVELQLMTAVWSLGQCTVKEVQTEILKTRELAYTTIATVMKILEQKGILHSTKGDKAHVYTSLVSKTEYESSSLKHLAQTVFEGDPTSMVMRLLSDTKLSKNDLAAIQKMIDARSRT